jgi:hypothetical protein
MCALTACPSGDAGVGAATTATAGMTGSTGGDESSTGFDTIADGSGGGTTAAPPVEVLCGELPLAAVGADYEHAFAVDPDGSWNWSVDGLPAGLNLSPISGSLSGAPEEEGSFELTVAVEGSQGMGEASCMLEVGPALSSDLSVLARPCVGPEDSLEDLLIGGDGSPVTCSTPTGTGDGTRPEAVTVNEESCAIEGEPTEDEYGTWVWMTEVEQSGARIYVPFCITQDTPPAGSFDVSMTFDGDTEALLEPVVGTFAVGEPLAFGGQGDPAFTVLGGCGPSSCFYAFNFVVGPSPFGGDCGQENCFGLAPSSIVDDMDGNPVGFRHEMFALGPEAPDTFADRAFVLPWNLTYCIGATDADCEDVQANAGARVHVSLLMTPE